MNRSYYFNESNQRRREYNNYEIESGPTFTDVVTPYRVCREIKPNGSHTFNIPPPSPKRARSNENEETPELILECFQRPPLVNFGKLTIGTEVSKSFVIINPADIEQQLKIMKGPKPDDGFVIDNKPITLNAGQKVLFNITWRPEKAGGVRSKIHFITSFSEKFEVTLLGDAAAKEKIKKRAKPKRRVIRRISLDEKKNKQTQTSPFVTKECDKRVNAAIVIQKNFKRYLAQRQYSKIKQAVIVIQRHWRNYIKQRSCNRRSTFVLKSAKQVLYQKENESARIIQRYFKGYLTRRKYKTTKQAACLIQKHWRLYLERKQHSKLCTSVLDSSSILAEKREQAAIIIQKRWRHYIALHESKKQELEHQLILQKKEAAALVIQKYFKGYLARKQYLKVKQAAYFIQKYWQNYRENLLRKKEKDAAIVIQKYCRKYLARKNYMNIKKSTIRIQNIWRNYIALRESEKQQLEHQLALQKREAAALVIQKYFKGYATRKQYLKVKQAACSIQKFWRSYRENSLRRKKEDAAVVIQKYFKRELARRNYILKRIAALRIQKQWRRRLVIRESNRILAFRITLKKLENQIAFLNKESAALVIQKHFKGYLARKQYLAIKQATCTIQKYWRNYRKERESNRRSTFVVHHNALNLTRTKEETAAVIIQKNFRKYSAQRHYANIKKSTSRIQKQWGEHIESRKQELKRQLDLRTSEEAALVIQKCFKRYLARKQYLEIKQAACLIQRYWRTYLKRRESDRRMTFVMHHNAQNLAQSKEEDAAVIIQKYCRKYLVRKKYIVLRELKKQELENQQKLVSQKKEAAALVIQKYFKGYLVRKKYLAIKQATCTTQKYWRRYLKRKQDNKLINLVIDKFSNGSASQRKEAAAIAIQRCWRNYCVRKCSPTLQNNSLQAKDTSTLTVGVRTEIAFKKLINYRKFCQLQTALSSLDATTKISPESCCKIASESTVDTILDIIKRSNRSEPSKIVILHAFNILLSLIKFEKTQDLIVNRRAVVDLCIEKAKVHNKVENIFCKCLTLIYLMVVKSSDRDALISDPKITKNMMSLITLESSFIKAHKKHKISKEIVFYPYWSSAKNVLYEFTDRFTALEHINHIFMKKLF